MKYKNPGVLRFDAEIISAGAGGGAYIEFPYDIQELFGTKGRVPVNTTFNNTPYRGSLMNMGTGCHIIGINKDIRSKANIQIGDKIGVVLELDTQARIAEISNDFTTLLKDNHSAWEFFNKLSYSHKREYIDWINDAKKQETRKRRILKAVSMLMDRKSLK